MASLTLICWVCKSATWGLARIARPALCAYSPAVGRPTDDRTRRYFDRLARRLAGRGNHRNSSKSQATNLSPIMYARLALRRFAGTIEFPGLFSGLQDDLDAPVLLVAERLVSFGGIFEQALWVITNDGSISPASIFEQQQARCSAGRGVWPILKVRPLFIGAPNGILSGTRCRRPGSTPCPPCGST